MDPDGGPGAERGPRGRRPCRRPGPLSQTRTAAHTAWRRWTGGPPVRRGGDHTPDIPSPFPGGGCVYIDLLARFECHRNKRVVTFLQDAMRVSSVGMVPGMSSNGAALFGSLHWFEREEAFGLRAVGPSAVGWCAGPGGGGEEEGRTDRSAGNRTAHSSAEWFRSTATQGPRRGPPSDRSKVGGQHSPSGPAEGGQVRAGGGGGALEPGAHR